MSQLVDIITEITSDLSGNAYSQTVNFEDSIIPRTKLDEMGTVISGHVYPRTHSRERVDRSNIQSDFGVMVAIEKKINSDDEVDAMMTLVEEVADSLDNLVTTNGRVTEVTIDPVFDFERLRERNVFTSIVRVQVLGR